MLRILSLIIIFIVPSILFGQDTFTSNVTDRGDWNNAASWTSLGSDADGLPDNNDNVIILNGDTINLVADEEVLALTINSGGVLLHTNGDHIDVYGNYINNGIQDGGNSASDLNFITAGSTVDGSGTIGNQGEIHIQANLTITASADLTVDGGTEIIFDGANTVTNNGTIDINDNLTGLAGCTWAQGTNAVLKFGHNSIPLIDGTLDCSTNANTFYYDRNNNHDSILPIDYHHLIIDISNTAKAANLKNDITVNGDLTINSGRLNTHAGITLTVSGITTLNTGGTLGFSGDATPRNNLQAVILNGGQLGRSKNGTINCTSITSSIRTSSKLNRCNLNVSGNVIINGSLNSNSNNGVKILSGDLTIAGTGSWSSTGNESFTIAGDFTNNGSFSTGTGDYTFTGATKSFNDASGLLTFGDNITIDGTYTNNVTSLIFTGDLQGTGSLTNAANKTLLLGEDVSISTLVATAIPNTVIYNGTTNQGAAETDYYNLTVSNTGTFPNNEVRLATGTAINVANLINITSGTLEFAGVNQQLTGNDVTMAAGTYFRIRTKGTVPHLTGTYTLASNSTFTFYRNGLQSISNAFTYQNLAFEGNGDKDLTGNTIIEGSLNIDGATVLDVSGSNYSLTVGGDWTSTSTNTDPFRQQAGTVTLNGTGSQTINSSVIGGETFNNLIISKASGGVTLNDSVQIDNLLTFNQGIISSSTAGLLTFNDGSNSNEGDADSFVDGPVKKIGNDAFTFPLGDGTIWARAAISAPSLVTDDFTAQYFATGQGDITLTGGLHNSSTIEYWTVNRGATTASDVSVTLHFENTTFSDINSLSTDLVVARFDGTDWTSEGQSAIPVSSVTTNSVVSAFGSFTFGSLSAAVNPLPVELLSFEAIEKDNKVELSWTTSIEINNDYFTIERSKNGKDFEVLKTIEGAGNSNQELNYSVHDNSPFKATSYYRLKQTDFNGEYEYFNIISVNIDESEIRSYPNPIKNILTLELENLTVNSSIRISDIHGKIVYDKKNISEEVLTIFSDKWAKGVYVVTLSDNQRTRTLKVIK